MKKIAKNSGKLQRKKEVLGMCSASDNKTFSVDRLSMSVISHLRLYFQCQLRENNFKSETNTEYTKLRKATYKKLKKLSFVLIENFTITKISLCQIFEIIRIFKSSKFRNKLLQIFRTFENLASLIHTLYYIHIVDTYVIAVCIDVYMFMFNACMHNGSCMFRFVCKSRHSDY